MKLADGSIIKENEIAPRLIEPVYRELQIIQNLYEKE